MSQVTEEELALFFQHAAIVSDIKSAIHQLEACIETASKYKDVSKYAEGQLDGLTTGHDLLVNMLNNVYSDEDRPI